MTSLASPRAKYDGVAAVLRGRHVEGQRHEQVVVQVVADRQVGQDRDAVLGEVVGVADAGQHQQLRRAEDAGGRG